jgi:hypothetical protein
MYPVGDSVNLRNGGPAHCCRLCVGRGAVGRLKANCRAEKCEEKEMKEKEEMFMYSRTRMVGGGRRELYPLELRIAVIGESFIKLPIFFFFLKKLLTKLLQSCWINSITGSCDFDLTAITAT